MALDKTIISNTFNKLLEQLPVTVTYSGSTYTGTKTIVNADRFYYDEGLQDNYSFSVHLLQADFSSLPIVDELVIIDSVSYRIIDIEKDAADCGIKIHLGERYAR